MIGAAIIGGLQVASAIGNYNQAKSQARQTIRQGNQMAENRAKEISRLVAQQRVSYLASGLELDGTPQSVMNDTYNTGLEDIKAIKSNAKTQAKNIIKQGQANLLGGLAQAGASAYSVYSGFSAPTSTQVGNTITATTNTGTEIWGQGVTSTGGTTSTFRQFKLS
jgi:hypothetical protein